MLEAAAVSGVQVIWDLCHYGLPDFHDPMAPGFADAFATFAVAAAQHHRCATGRAALLCPINEISFFAWAIDEGYFPSRGSPRGAFARQLAKAAIAAVGALRASDPDCRFIWAEPLIHVAPRSQRRSDRRAAEARRVSQFETYDRLTGRLDPELGGCEDIVDVVGLNFYPHNQWYLHGGTIPMGHHEHRALADMLGEVHQRYTKPILIAETGAEGSGRAAWLHYVCDEVRAAAALGVPVAGICLYPVTAYPGWDNSRHAEAGLFSNVTADGERHLYQPLADELSRQQRLFGLA